MASEVGTQLDFPTITDSAAGITRQIHSYTIHCYHNRKQLAVQQRPFSVTWQGSLFVLLALGPAFFHHAHRASFRHALYSFNLPPVLNDNQLETIVLHLLLIFWVPCTVSSCGSSLYSWNFALLVLSPYTLTRTCLLALGEDHGFLNLFRAKFSCSLYLKGTLHSLILSLNSLQSSRGHL